MVIQTGRNIQRKYKYVLNLKTTKIKEKIECINFSREKVKPIEIKTIKKCEKITPNFDGKCLNFGLLNILAKSLFRTGSVTNRTLTVIREGCSVKTNLRKNLGSFRNWLV